MFGEGFFDAVVEGSALFAGALMFDADGFLFGWRSVPGVGPAWSPVAEPATVWVPVDGTAAPWTPARLAATS